MFVEIISILTEYSQKKFCAWYEYLATFYIKCVSIWFYFELQLQF